MIRVLTKWGLMYPGYTFIPSKTSPNVGPISPLLSHEMGLNVSWLYIYSKQDITSYWTHITSFVTQNGA